MTNDGDPRISIRQEPNRLTARMIDSLRGTRPWVRLVSIIGFCLCALLIVLAGGMLLVGALAEEASPYEAGFLAFVYVFFAFVYVVPSLYLNQYAGAIARIPEEGDRVRDVEAALDLQRAFWKFTGVAAVMIVILWLFLLVGAIAVGLLEEPFA